MRLQHQGDVRTRRCVVVGLTIGFGATVLIQAYFIMYALEGTFSPKPQADDVLATDAPSRSVPQRRLSFDVSVWTEPQTSTCGRLFANGFSDAVAECSPALRCSRNPTSLATLCVADDLVIDRSFISVSAGGEPIEEVAGRDEAEEFPVYRKGALALSDAGSCPAERFDGNTFPHHLALMLSSIANGASDDVLDGITLLVTRYEYANLYHTMTDWYNTFQAWMMAIGDAKRDGPLRIVFVDGHSSGALDKVWGALFGVEPVYISSLPQRVRFRHAVFVPVGYTSALSLGTMQVGSQCSRHPALVHFANYFMEHVGGPPAAVVPKRPVILFVVRRDYLAHPRIGARKAERKIRNEDELVGAAQQAFPDVDVEKVAFEEMDVSEQVVAVHRATVVVGVHGAGLTHILFARGGAALIELMPPEYAGRQHFQFISRFIGCRYVAVPVQPSDRDGYHQVPIRPVISEIAQSLNKVV
ncbi:Glycosyltransferase 61 catalytic domain-containing protein [Plasmodiophora brassicae]